MTTTTAGTKRESTGPATGGAAPQVATSTPPISPVRTRRRPLLIVAGLALVVLGALGAAWAWIATTQTNEVVAVRADIARGEVIAAEDLMGVRMSVDPAVSMVPVERVSEIIGQRAAVDLRAGALLPDSAATAEVLPPAGFSVVGLALGPELLPGEPLVVGDQVRVISTPGQQGDPSEAPQSIFEAVVVGVHPEATTGRTVIAVQVPEQDAPVVASWASTGRVVVVLDTRDRGR